ncbi:MAG: amidohydrolase family protein [candidate division WS1 bacterium]|jgi:predicted TIM-barrel fold metal-dependent hydrolase|nr:amidohydrolase family protein [candidate division WS1 bacterium]
MKAFREELLQEMQSLRTVDCHSHTVRPGEYQEAAPLSLFGYSSYFDRTIDSVTGGSRPQLYAGCTTDEQRWERLKPVLAKARNVSYWRHHIVTHQGLFDLADDDLTDANWAAINATIHERTADPDWYRHVTEDICALQTQVRNIPWFEDWEPEYFTAILRMESALELQRQDVRESLEAHLDRSIGNLAEAKEALAELVAQYEARGALGIKLAHAYRRTLHSERVSAVEASATFDRGLRGLTLKQPAIKRLQDHIIFFLAGVCEEMGLVFDIHTGVQGNWGNVPDSNPLHLLPLIHAHPKVRFSLYHGGYPYSREMGMLAKHSPNVWLNLAWMFVVTMEGTRQSLSEWLDLVPGYRILGFGSDVGWPEMIYGHLVMARSCIADVLAEKAERDFLSRDAALDLARMMMRDNGMALYGA